MYLNYRDLDLVFKIMVNIVTKKEKSMDKIILENYN